MFDEMKRALKDWDDDLQIEAYLDKLVRKEAFDRSGLIYGIGHAVYATSDPRSLILRDHVGKLVEAKGLAAEMNLCWKVERPPDRGTRQLRQDHPPRLQERRPAPALRTTGSAVTPECDSVSLILNRRKEVSN